MGPFQAQCRRLGPGCLPSWTPGEGDGPRSEEIRASGCAQQHLDQQSGPHLLAGPRSPGAEGQRGMAEAWTWEGQSTRDGVGQERQPEQQLVRAWG